MSVPASFRRILFLLFALLCLLPPAWAAELPDLVPLVKKLKPSVVNISTTQKVQAGGINRLPPEMSDSPFQEFFRRFMEQMPEREFKSRSLGSGVIIDDDGHILTNHHVVENAQEIVVRLADNDEKEYKAEVVGSDAKTDLALIRIKADHKPTPARLGNSDTAEVGSWVVAIGNPFGLSASVTLGIISAKERIIGNGPYDDFIQTDAAINPGNSGGPLFNLQGEVIGINTAIYSRDGGNMGIGFAIPVNMAKSIVQQLKSSGRVTRGWLGVRIQSVTPELAKALGLPQEGGALVASVESDSPASRAGFQSGDVITTFDGKPIHKMNDLPAIVADTPVNKEVPVEVVRGGGRKTIQVVIAQMVDEESPTRLGKAGEGDGKDKVTALGLTVRNITPEVRQQLELTDDVQGVVVISSDHETGDSIIMPGDLIVQVNRQVVRNLSDYREITGKLKSGQHVLILVMRRGEPLFLALQAP